MGQLVTTVAGAALGFLVGGPVGASIGATLGSMAGMALFAPTFEGPRLNDLKVSASTYGKPIPEMYGTVRLGGNMIWSSGIQEREEEVSAGGKGGPSQTVYKYSASYAMAICKGPVDDLTRIWADGKLIYDKTNSQGVPVTDVLAFLFGITDNPLADTGLAFREAGANWVFGGQNRNIRFRLYRGTEDQEPDSLIEADKGVGNVSAHRGLCYIVVENHELEDFGNRIPQLTFEVTKNPQQLVTVATLKNVGGESNFLNFGLGTDFYPDWDLGVGFVAANTSRTFDLNTMTLFNSDGGRNSDKLFYLEDRRQKYLQGMGLWLHTDGLRNSAPLDEYSIFSLSKVATYGETNNNTFGAVNYGANFGFGSGAIGFGSSNSYSLGNLGQIGFCRTNSTGLIYLLVGWRRVVWIIRTTLDWPAAGGFTVDWVPTRFIEGRRYTSVADIIGWRAHNGQLQLQFWTIPSNIEYEEVEGENGPDWKGSEEYQLQYMSLQPFGALPEFRNVSWSFEPLVVCYDVSDDGLFALGEVSNASLGTQVAAMKWQRTTGQWIFRKIYFRDEVGPIEIPDDTPSHPNHMEYSRLEGGTFGWGHSQPSVGRKEGLHEIDLQTGELITSIQHGNQFGNRFVRWTNMHWDDRTRSLVARVPGDSQNVYNSDNERYVRITFGMGVNQITIRDVVREVCLNTGLLDSEDIDVSELNPDPLTGYHVDNVTSASAILRQLATGFMFDGFESDYKLTFRSRGRDPDVTIPEDWIGRDSDNNVVVDTITQELELPMRVSVNYYDITRDHNQGTQTDKRISAPVATMLSERENVVDLPVTWRPDNAKQAANKLLKMSWANRVNFEFSLPWRYLKYDPGDVARINMESGTTHIVRISDINLGADFSLAINGQSEKASAYDSNLRGIAADVPTQTISAPFPALAEALNTPLLRDVEFDPANNSRIYLGATTLARGFTGATIFVADNEEFYRQGTVSNALVTGFCQTALPNTTSWASTDNKTQLFVRLLDPTKNLESITQSEMLNSEDNAALVGDEIIQFRDAVKQSDGSWRLTGLLRARRGTNDYVGTHREGDRFILLQSERLITDLRPPSDYNATIQTRAVPRGTRINEAQPQTFVLTPRDLQPYTPEAVKVSDNGTNVTVSMQRRSRIISPLVANTGSIHYKEGDKTSAKIKYSVWFNRSLSQRNQSGDPDVEGNMPLFDSSGDDVAASFTFPLADLTPDTRALVRLVEVGVVDGIPKWVQIDRVGANLWNVTELY